MPVALSAGQHLVVPVSFEPTEAGGAWSYLYVLAGDGQDGTVPIEMAGIGTTGRALAASAATLSFGSEPTGTIAVQRVASPIPGQGRKRSPPG